MSICLCLSVCLRTCLCHPYLPFYVSVSVSPCASVCLFVKLSLCLSICLHAVHVCPSASLPPCMCVFVCLYVSVPISISLFTATQYKIFITLFTQHNNGAKLEIALYTCMNSSPTRSPTNAFQYLIDRRIRIPIKQDCI